MTRDMTLGLARHLLTFVGGLLVTKGYVDAASFESAVGAAITIAGVIWSAAEKKAR